MIFDVHAHVGEDMRWPGREITAENILKVMDESGIDRAVLIPSSSMGRIMPAEKVQEEANKAPDRLVAFTSVNPKEPNAARDLARAVADHGARGLKIHPTCMAVAADDKDCVYPLIEMAEEVNIPVMFHSGEGPYATPWQIGLVALDFPNVTIIMEHMGLDAMCFTEAAIRMAKKANNIILGTTGVMFEFPIARAVDAIGAERVVYGGEIPFNNPVHEILKVKVAKISEEDKEKILGKNIMRILGLTER